MPRFKQELITKGPVLTVAAIVLTGILTYVPGIFGLGYYHDDWYMLWSAAARGAQSLVPLFSTDRPFMGVLYTVYYQIFGQNIFGWHFAALLWRIAGGLAFYWILSLVWPNLKRFNGLAAMLFLVFPGFLSEPNAATKINHLTGFGAALISIALTLQAAATRRRLWKFLFTALSMLLMAFYLWIYEYMLGLEMMRVALLFWMLWRGQRCGFFSSLKTVILSYLPYVLIAGVFMVWRVFIFESTRNAMDMRSLLADYRSDFFGMAGGLVAQVIKDFLSSSVFAWMVEPYTLLAQASSSEMAAAFLAGGALALLAVVYLWASREDSPEPEERQPSPVELIFSGALIALAAVSPVVLSDRHLDLLDAYKSYGLHPSGGAIILMMGLVLLLNERYRKAAFIALLALSGITQALNTQDWTKYWEIQKSAWWQLTWRAPDILDNTLVMAYLPEGNGLREDYEIFGPVNLIYRPTPMSTPAIQAEILNQDTLNLVSRGNFDGRYVRDIFLGREFGSLLLISQPTVGSCIHVIDGDMPAYSASERPLVKLAGQYSQVSRIVEGAAAPIPPLAIFGSEPERGWCFYYQQASLARQSGDWQRIASLYDTLAAAGLKASDSTEYFVFIEGLVNSGRKDTAERIIANGLKENAVLIQSWCTSLSSAPDYPDSFGYQHDQIKQILCEE